jgi:hypothetical protein
MSQILNLIGATLNSSTSAADFRNFTKFKITAASDSNAMARNDFVDAKIQNNVNAAFSSLNPSRNNPTFTNIKIPSLNTPGVLHNNSNGVITSSKVTADKIDTAVVSLNHFDTSITNVFLKKIVIDGSIPSSTSGTKGDMIVSSGYLHICLTSDTNGAGAIWKKVILNDNAELNNFNIPALFYGSSTYTIIPPTSKSGGEFSYSVSNTNIATVYNKMSPYSITIPSVPPLPKLSVTNFPALGSLSHWEMNIRFNATGASDTWRGIIGDMYNDINVRGWGLWISNANRLVFSWNEPAWGTAITVSLNKNYILKITRTPSSMTMELTNISETPNTQQTDTNNSMSTYVMSTNGPVTIGGWINHQGEKFIGTISYVNVNDLISSYINIVNVGTTTITATQAAYGNFTSNTISTTLVINPTLPILSNFTIVSNETPLSQPFQLKPPTSTSSGAFTYSVPQGNGVVTINGNTVTVIGAGTVTITATQAASGDYSSGSITTSLTIIIPALSNFIMPASKTDISQPFTLTPPTSPSSGAFTYSVPQGNSIVIINENTVTPIGQGTITVTATQAASGNYLSNSITATLIIISSTPVLSNFNIPTLYHGSSAYTIIPPTSNSDGEFSYSVSNTNIATVYKKMSPYTITNPSLPSLNVTNFPALGLMSNWEMNIRFNATGASDTWRGIIGDMYNNSNSRGWGLWISNANRLFFSWNGPTWGTAITVSLNKNYILKITRTPSSMTMELTNISETPNTQQTDTNNSMSTYVMSTNGPVTIGGWINYQGENFIGTISYVNVNDLLSPLINIVNVGTTTITATQAAYGNFTSNTISTTLVVNPNIPILSNFTIVSNKTPLSQPFQLTSPTSPSSGAFTYSVPQGNGVVTINGNTVTVIGEGTVTVTATQAASGNYTSNTITATLIIISSTPVLSNFNIPALDYGSSAYTITPPSSNSSGDFTYSIQDSSIATLGGGYCLSFDGDNDFVTFGLKQEYLISSAITMECFFKTNINPPLKSASTLLSRYETGGYNTGASYSIGLSSLGNVYITITGERSVDNWFSISSPNSYADKNWHSMAATYNSSTGYLALYIDGILVNSDTKPYFGLISTNNIMPLIMGNDSSGSYFGASDRQFNGCIAGMRLWNVARSASQVYAGINTYNKVLTSTSGLVGYWKLNQNSGTIVNDSSGNNNNGTLVNFALSGSSNWDNSFIGETTINPVTIGTTTITATQAAYEDYLSSTDISTTIVINTAIPILSNFTVPSNITEASDQFTLIPPSSISPGAFTYTASPANIVNITDNIVKPVAPGTVTITASQASYLGYSEASIAVTFVVIKVVPLLSNFNLPIQHNDKVVKTIYNFTPPTSDIDGVFSYTINDNSIADITSINSLTFNGSSHISCGYNDNYGIIFSISVEYWFKTSYSASTQVIVSKTRHPFSGYRDKESFSTGLITGGKIYFYVVGNNNIGSPNTFTLYGNNYYADNNWHSVSVTYNSYSKYMAIYVDGILDNSGYNNVFPNISNGIMSTHSHNAPLQIGWDGETYPSDTHFRGELSKIRLWARDLSNWEVYSIYNTYNILPGNTSELRAYFKLNELSGTIAYDSSSRQNTGGTLIQCSFTNNRNTTNILNVKNIGTTIVTAKQEEYGIYKSNTITTTLTVINFLTNFTVPDNKTSLSEPFQLTPPTSNSNGQFTYSVPQDNGVVTINGNTVTPIAAGMVTVTATQAASGNYSSHFTTALLTIN